MKRIKYTCSFLAILLLLIPGILASCIRDELIETEERGLIVMSLDGVTTRGAGDPLNSGDAIINKVRIFVFVGQVLEVNRVFTAGNPDFNNPFVLNVATGPKTVYVVANEPDEMTPILDDIINVNMITSVITPPVIQSLTVPLTMVGKSGPISVQYVPEPGPHTQVTIKLYRLATMLNLKIKKGLQAEANNIPIILKNVQIWRIPKRSSFMEGLTFTGQGYWNYNYTGQSQIDLTTTGVDAWTSATPMYLYENPGSVNDTTDRATYLIIEAIYNGVNTRYRTYINDATSSADHHYSTKRNHQYNLVATINDIGEFDGLTVQTHVLPWNLWKSELLFERVYTISPQPTPENHIYTVNNTTDEVTFTFKVTNPLGAEWRAHLSNPAEFEFSTAGGAVYEGLLGEEYTIKIKPRNPQDATARTTEFYITVGSDYWAWVEIPLIEGSILVGPGNRVVINQPALP